MTWAAECASKTPSNIISFTFSRSLTYFLSVSMSSASSLHSWVSSRCLLAASSFLLSMSMWSPATRWSTSFTIILALHTLSRKCHWWLSTLSLTNIPRVSEDCRSFIAVAGTRLLLLTGIWVTVSSFYSGCCHPAAAEQPSEPRGPRPPVAPCHGGGAWKPVIIWRYLHQYLHQYLHGAVRSCAAPRLPWSAAAARLAAAGAGPRLAMCPHSAVRSAGAREAAYTGSSPRTAFCADTLSWSCYAIKYRGLKVLCFF